MLGSGFRFWLRCRGCLDAIPRRVLVVDASPAGTERCGRDG